MAMGGLTKIKEIARGENLEGKPRTRGGRQPKVVAENEDAAKRMLKHLEDSEDLKVSLGELKEPLESPEEAGISIRQIAKQARNERGQKTLPDLQARRE